MTVSVYVSRQEMKIKHVVRNWVLTSRIGDVFGSKDDVVVAVGKNSRKQERGGIRACVVRHRNHLWIGVGCHDLIDLEIVRR